MTATPANPTATTPRGGAHPRTGRAAVVLAAGHDDASRELLSRPLGDATVVELAVANVRRVVDAGRIVVVVSPDDPTVRELLGEDVVPEPDEGDLDRPAPQLQQVERDHRRAEARQRRQHLRERETRELHRRGAFYPTSPPRRSTPSTASSQGVLVSTSTCGTCFWAQYEAMPRRYSAWAAA